MKIFLHTALFIISFFELTRAQNVVGDIQGKGLDIQTNSGGFVTQLPPAPPETKGHVFLNADWSMADVQIFGQEIEMKQLSVRLNLQNNDLEIRSAQEVKVLSGTRVKLFRLTNSLNNSVDTFVNARAYKFNGSPLFGFFRVADTRGTWELLEKTELKLIEGSYVAALDAGDKNNRLVKEQVYYFAEGAKLYRVFPSVKKFCGQFKDGAPLRSYIKSKKIRLKQKDDLRLVAEFLGANY